MTYLQDLPPAHHPAQLNEAVQDVKTSCWQHEQPDTTSNFSATGKSYSREKLNFGYCFARVAPSTLEGKVISKSSFRAQRHVIQEEFVQTNWLQTEVVSLIPFCHSFQAYSEPYRRKQRSRSERYQGDYVSRALEQDSTLHWLLVSESPVLLQATIKENLRR